MGNRWLKIIVILGIVGVASAIFYKKVYIPKSTYKYVEVKRADLVVSVFGIGNVSAKNIYPVSSNSGGKIIKIFKDQGEFIKKGEVVALLDPVDLSQQLQQAKASLKKAQYEKSALKQELSQLQSQYALIKKNFDRYSFLYKKGFASEAEYDKVLTDLRVVQAQIGATKAKILANNHEIKRIEYSIKALEEKLSRCKIVSMVDGYVVQKKSEVGQTIAAQQPIVLVVKPKEVWVKSYIDERISADIVKGQKARVTLRSRAQKPLRGYVARIEAQSDPVTEERIVDIAFEKVPFPFYLNEQAQVEIEIKKLQGVLVIPIHLVHNERVWIYKDGKAHLVHVQVIAKNDSYAAIKGLAEGDKILVPERDKRPLFDGADVRI